MPKFLRAFYDTIRSNRLALIALALAATQVGIYVLSYFLRGGNIIHAGVSRDDAIDLLTPVLIIPLTWLFFTGLGRDPPKTYQSLIFLIASIIWVDGHGIHLSSDSIGNMLGEDTATQGGSLIYFYDEVLGHHLWQAGIILQSVSILHRGWSAEHPVPMGNFFPFLVSGLWYGFLFFGLSIEGQTVPLGISASVLIGGMSLWRWRSKRRIGPADVVFISGYALALYLIIGWGVWHQGFPEFSHDIV